MVTNIHERIKEIAIDQGAELVGIAPSKILEEMAPEGHKPSDLLPDAKSIIVVAGGNSLNEDRLYLHEIGSLSTFTYIELKDGVRFERRRTRAVVQAIHDFLLENGLKSAIESHGWSDVLSFKQASYYAGLGVFGKGTFIIHPNYGTINVLGCIITNADLEYNRPMDMDLCGECKECIKACKFGAFKKEGESFLWVEKKCAFYDTIKTPSETIVTYGPCNGDCINLCPVGTGNRVDKISDSDKSQKKTLDKLMKDLKPIMGDTQYDDRQIIQIQEVFKNMYLTPINYEGIMQKSGFAVWITDEDMQNDFQCKKIWVEMASQNKNLFNKIYDLRDILNHEWGILIIREDATYDFLRPLIWSKIMAMHKLDKHI